MLTKHTPIWILIGGGVLAGCAGVINAVGFLGVHHRALSHLSGPITVLSTDLSAADFRLALHAFLVVAAFFSGCVLSGFIIRQSTLKLGRRYGFALGLESLLLIGAVHYLKQGAIRGDCLAAMACGLQNAMATNYSGAIIRTTHMTGVVTDLGLACGHFLRGLEVEWGRLRLLATLLAGFFIGGIFGAIGFRHLAYETLYIPAALTGLTGIAYSIYKHIERVRKRNAVTPAT
ncbi:MAG: YoaK family protein [Rariglobus sp.]